MIDLMIFCSFAGKAGEEFFGGRFWGCFACGDCFDPLYLLKS